MSIQPLYIQEAHLPNVFDLSIDWFIQRKNKLFFEGQHFFPARSSSRTKKAVLWHLQETELVLRSGANFDAKVEDKELSDLLSRIR